MSEEIAAEGCDVVAYHTERRRVAGSDRLTHHWRGTQWRFANERNRDAFAAEPERYAPQYGGQCAFAMSLGKQAPGSSRHWTLEDGRLFLQSNAVAALLFRLMPGRVRAADARWEGERSDS